MGEERGEDSLCLERPTRRELPWEAAAGLGGRVEIGTGTAWGCSWRRQDMRGRSLENIQTQHTHSAPLPSPFSSSSSHRTQPSVGGCAQKSKEGSKISHKAKSLFLSPSSPPRLEQHCSPPWMFPWAPDLSLCCSKCGIHGAVSDGKLISCRKEPSHQAEDCGLYGTSPKKR